MLRHSKMLFVVIWSNFNYFNYALWLIVYFVFEFITIFSRFKICFHLKWLDRHYYCKIFWSKLFTPLRCVMVISRIKTCLLPLSTVLFETFVAFLQPHKVFSETKMKISTINSKDSSHRSKSKIVWKNDQITLQSRYTIIKPKFTYTD